MKTTAQLSLFDIDSLIKQVEATSMDDTAQRILVESDFVEKRNKVIEWVKKEKVKIIIAFSGGKDSVAMALYLHFELGIPKDHIELWHHMVDGEGEPLFDWPCTSSYCEAFAEAFDFNLLFSYRKGGIVREIVREDETLQDVYFQEVPGGRFHLSPSKQEERYLNTRRKFPAVSMDLKTRWCSDTVKISVMAKAITNSPRFLDANVLICTGERRAESAPRSKYQEIEAYKRMSKTRRALVYRPVLDWSDAEVWAILEKYGVQPHPAYMLGWSRCSCQTCLFSSPNTWASLAEIQPNKIERLAEVEKEIGFTMYSGMSILDKVRSGKSFIPNNSDSYSYWIEQATGEFTAPMIIQDWILPIGAKSFEKAGAN